MAELLIKVTYNIRFLNYNLQLRKVFIYIFGEDTYRKVRRTKLYQLIKHKNPVFLSKSEFTVIRNNKIKCCFCDALEESRKYVALHRKLLKREGPAITIATLSGGYQQPFHKHNLHPEYVLTFGPLTLKYYDNGEIKTINLNFGDVLYVPAIVQHTIKNISSTPVVTIAVKPIVESRIFLSHDNEYKTVPGSVRTLHGNRQKLTYGTKITHEISNDKNFKYMIETIELASKGTFNLEPNYIKHYSSEEVVISLESPPLEVDDKYTTDILNTGDSLYIKHKLGYRITNTGNSKALLYRVVILESYPFLFLLMTLKTVEI